MKTGSHTSSILRKGFAILLLAAFMYNVVGYFVVFRINRSLVRAEMMKELARSGHRVVVLRIFDAANDPSFRRVDKKEFEYKGQMYDVVSEITRDRVTSFYCVRDTREELLLDGMRKAAGAKNTQNLVHNLITLAMPVIPKPESLRTSSDIIFPIRHDRLLHRAADPLPPPPRLV